MFSRFSFGVQGIGMLSGMLFGVGFPPFRGGLFRWMDTVGLAHIKEMSDKFAHLGKAYELTDRMNEMRANGETYY